LFSRDRDAGAAAYVGPPVAAMVSRRFAADLRAFTPAYFLRRLLHSAALRQAIFFAYAWHLAAFIPARRGVFAMLLRYAQRFHQR